MGLFDMENATETVAQTQTVEATATEAVEKRTYGKKPMSEKNAPRVEADKKKREALERVFQWVKDNGDKVPENIRKDCEIVRPSFFGVASAGGAGFEKLPYTGAHKKLASILGLDVETLKDTIKAGATFTDIDCFKKIKAGERDMRELCNALIREPRELPQIWVKFDEASGVYTVVAVGDMPKDWDGYLPKAKEAESK